MNFLELAKKRYSVRKFTNQIPEKEKLMKILEAGRIAPSAVNFQPWHFVVITEKEALENIYSVYHRDWINEAPVVIVVCGDHEKSWKRKADGKDFCDVDVSIAVDHMTLEATNLGMGTCWVCNFDKQDCIEVLGLPKNIEPIVILPMGYPADEVDENRHETKRKKIEEIVHWQKF